MKMKKAKQRMVLLLATGGGVGLVPAAPGTFGSLVGLALCFLLSRLDFLLAFLSVIVLIFLAVPICAAAENLLGKTDPGAVVIDEIAGMAVSLVGIDFGLLTALAGFGLFRLLDIAKPFPIGYLEKRFSGGVGIVIDDVAAGVLVNLILRSAMALARL